MRSLGLSLLFLVLSLAVVVPATWSSAAQDKTLAVSILVEHNGVRQKYNVPLLTWDDGLAKLAQDWADKIAVVGARYQLKRFGFSESASKRQCRQ